jgi:hypothetical protein
MQGATFRFLILAGVFALGAVLLGFAGNPAPLAAPRWPTEDDLFSVDGWSVGPATVERINGLDYITRRYGRADSTTATFVLSTAPTAKPVYAAGPDVPFHGTGFTVGPAAVSLSASSQVAAFTARKEREEYLVLFAFGERRGLAGNGLQAWGMAGLDALFGQPNDYFLARVVVPVHEIGASRAGRAADLAESLFPRLAGWYGKAS